MAFVVNVTDADQQAIGRHLADDLHAAFTDIYASDAELDRAAQRHFGEDVAVAAADRSPIWMWAAVDLAARLARTERQVAA